MSLLFITPLKGLSWSPNALTGQKWWYRSDHAVVSGSDLTSWTQLYSGAPSVNMPFSGTPPQLQTAAINGRDAFDFATNTIGRPTSPVNAQVIDPALPFCVAYVHKGPTLTLGTYYSLFTLAAATDADSLTLFYTNLTGLPEFYLQVGNGSVYVIGVASFANDSWHSAILVYDGNGYGNASSWSLVINGTPFSVTDTASSGGDTAQNTLGDASGGGASNAGSFAEYILAQENVTGGTLANFEGYFNTVYGL